MIKCAVLASLLCAATPVAADRTTSYRAQTLAADGIGIGLYVAGGFAEGESGRDTTASTTLFTVGLLGALVATPAIHLGRGHLRRAAGSLVLRMGMAGAGMLITMMDRRGCDDAADDDDELLGDSLCVIDNIGYGLVGGLIAASLIDAAFNTDERERRRWAPQIRTNRDGVRVGATWSW